ncbi:hypothetical protein [Amycolatopsis sp. lyj-112]|uniref:hypothetical protein n=1 Tax=Amycolatopsis sp. lyj-112 TaxID=2789288 RepID=UPI00397C0558
MRSVTGFVKRSAERSDPPCEVGVDEVITREVEAVLGAFVDTEFLCDTNFPRRRGQCHNVVAPPSPADWGRSVKASLRDSESLKEAFTALDAMKGSFTYF